LGHLSMPKIQYMASKGILPKLIAACPIPICQSCLFGKIARKAWRTKQAPIPSRMSKVTQPGACVSVDQMECPAHCPNEGDSYTGSIPCCYCFRRSLQWVYIRLPSTIHQCQRYFTRQTRIRTTSMFLGCQYCSRKSPP
jgi:hypothetical protein